MVYLGIISITTVVFGIASLMLISRARKKLSEGSLKRYLDNFALCMAFIVIFSIWQTIRILFHFPVNVENLLEYPEYFFLIFAYAAFIITSYRIVRISHEFGFKEDGKRIRELIIRKSRRR
ncbi:hypothetical protein HYU10_00725 [Candidatus Woesearchaeota archaeon]|nr:hypothetical protein [Candidatus Woesearchaeota archaeon]MBI2130273.1 hypothetical protein [Candidatus Woesearchaeota archaeon]MBI2660776.1 hypothetical protein [Candidatus Woesearchaeota archaeon]